MKNSYQNSLFTPFLIILVFMINSALAQTTYTWKGGAAPWDSAANWTPVGIPGSGDTAIINSGDVTLVGDVEVSGLTLGSAVINGIGNITVTGLFNWTNGRIDGSDSVFVAPGATLELAGIADKELNGRILVNNGTINWTGTGQFRMRNGAVIQNPAGKTITIQNNSAFKYSSPGGGSVINGGTITKSAGGGLTDFEVHFTNNGTVNLNSGSLIFRAGSNGSNSIYNAAAGSIATFFGGIHNLENIEFNGGTAQFNDGTFNVNGSGITVNPATSLEVKGASAIIQGSGPFTINGNITWERGTITGSGAFTVNGTLTLSGIYVKILDGRTLTNNGTIHWLDTGNLRFANNAVLSSGANTVVNLLGDAVLDYNDPSGGTFINAGTINKTVGSTHSIFDVNFENTGPINVSSGNLRLTRGSTHTGTIFNVSAGSNILLESGTHTFNDVAFSGAGRTRHLSNTVSITGAGITINSGGTYEMAGGFLIGDAPITNNGTFDWSGGSISGTGQFTSNSTFLFSGTSLKQLEQRTLSNNGAAAWLGSGEVRLGTNAHFINQASGSFDIQGNAAMNFIFPSSSTFSNFGSITKSAGTGVSLLNVVLNNSGPITVSSGTLRLFNGGSHSNITVNVAPNALLIFDGAAYNIDNVAFSGGGIARVDDASLLLSGSGISVAPGATLALNGSNGVLQGSAPVTINGSLIWSRGTVSGAGTLDINGVLNFEGSSSKTLIAKTLNNNGSLLWTGNGALRFNNNAQLLNKAGSTIDMQTGTVFQALSATPGHFDNSGTLTKSGGQDSLIIDIPYTSSGGININSGKLRFTEPGSITGSTITLGNGTIFEYDGGAHVLNNASFSGNGTVVLKRDFLTINGTTTPFSSGATLKIVDGVLSGTSSIIADGLEWQRGTISGSGSVTVNNTLKLNTNNFKALIQKSLINNGTATWSDSGDIRLQDGASLQNQAGATFEILNDAPVRFIAPTGGSMFNAGSMIKHTGSGITQFETNFGNSGLLDIQTGTLRLLKPLVNAAGGTIKGSGTLNVTGVGLTNHGNINPGSSPGKLTIIGNAGQTTTAALNVELGGVVPGSSYDQLVISNAGVLNGALNISYANGFIPSPGDEYTILTANPRINQFTSINVPAGPADFTVTYTPSSVVLHTIRSNVEPNVADDFVDIDEDLLQEFDVLSNDSDGDGDTLVITSYTQPLHGTLTQTGDSTFSYLSDLNFIGADSFSYSVIDGYGGSGSATVYITVLPVNDPPVVSTPLPNVTFPEEGSYNLDLTPYASDIDNNVNELSWGAVVISAQPPGGAGGSEKLSASGNIEVDPSDLQISIDPLTQLATFTATDDSSGIFEVVFTVSDPGGLSDNDTMQVTVTGASDPPYVANPIPDQTFPEDSGPNTAVQNLNTVFSDPDPGTVFTFSTTSNNPNILPQVQGTSLLINSALNFTGSGNVIVTANDGTGTALASDTFSVTITPVNDPPVVSTPLPNVTFPEDGSHNLDLDPYASDIDNNVSELSWAAVVISAQPLGGAGGSEKPGVPGNIEVDPSDLQISIDPLTHVATFTATSDSTGIFEVVFTVSDPGGLSDNDTMQVTVTGASDPPYVANPIPNQTYPEDSGPNTAVQDLNTVFSDPDPGAVLTFSTSSGNANILPQVQGNSLVLNSALNFTGSGNVIVNASDGTGTALASDTFSVTFTPVNDPPVVSTPLPNVTFPEDGSIDLNLEPYASDIDNNVSELSWAAVVINAQPIASNLSGGKAGGSGNIEVDPSDLQVSIDPLTHVATFTATGDTSGIFTVAFTVSDPGGLSDNDTMQVTVVGVNDPPYVVNPIPDQTYPEDGGPHTAVQDLNTVFSDPDPGTTFTFSTTASNPNILPQVQGNSLVLNSALNYTGTGNVTVTANDGAGRAVASDIFSVTYTPVNDPPVVSTPLPNINFPEDGSYNLDLDSYASDIDNNVSELSWAAVVIGAQPTGGNNTGGSGNIEVDPSDLQISIDPLTHVATFTVTGDTSGIFQVAFTVSDPGGLSDNDTMRVTVTAVNDPPFVVNPIPDQTYVEDSGAHTAVQDLNTVFSDPDPGAIFTFSTAASNVGILPQVQGASLVINSALNFTGTGSVTVTANDGAGRAVASDTFSVTYTPVNDPPAISANFPNLAFPEDSVYHIDLDNWVIDPDNTPAVLSWLARVISAQSGNLEVDTTDLQVTIDPLTHVATFTPTPDSTGIFEVEFVVEDPQGLSDTDTMQVKVLGAGDPPYVVNPIPDVSYPEDSGDHVAVNDLNVIFFDPDPTSSFVFSAVSNNPNILANIQGDDTLVVSSALNFNGSGVVIVTADDGTGFAVNDTFVVTITPVNDPPVVSTPLPNINFPEDGSHNFDLDPYAGDIDNNVSELNWAATVITAQPIGGNGGGSGNIEVDPSDLQVSIDPLTHVATFTATGDTSGIFTVAFTVSDPGGLSDNDTMQVTVTGVNDPPFVVNPIPDQTYPEDSGSHTAVQNLNTVFSDPDPGATFTFSAAASNANILPQVQGTSLVLNSALNYTGTGDVFVTANDGAGRAVASDTFSVTYTPVNDPPVVSTPLPDVTFPEDGSYNLDLDPYASDIDNNSGELSWAAVVINAQSLGANRSNGKTASGKSGGSGNIEVDPSDLQISIDPLTHVATFTATGDSSGIFTVAFTVSDPGGLSDNDTMQVTVTAVNDPPFVVNPISDQTYVEDGGAHTAVQDLNTVFSDPDPGFAFTFSAAASNANILPQVQGDSLVINSALNYTGTGNVTVTANDGAGRAVASDSFSVTYTPVNDPPAISANFPNLAFPEDSVYYLDLDNWVNDVDNIPAVLSWQARVISAQSNNLEVDTTDLVVTIDPLTHVAAFTPTPDSTGIFQVEFVVEDPEGLSDTDTMEVKVLGASDPPFVVNPIPDVNYPEDGGPHVVVGDLNIVFFDPDPSSSFVFSAVSNNPNIPANVQGNDTLVVNSALNYNGSGTVIVTADDGTGFAVSDTFIVTITPVNDPPVVSTPLPDVTFPEDGSYDLDLNPYASDIDNSTGELSWVAVVIDAQPAGSNRGNGKAASGKSGGSGNIEVDPSDLQISIDPLTHLATFAATSDTSGIFQVVFTVSDPGGLSDNDTMRVVVTGVGDPPFVINPIDDVVYPEDIGSQTVVANLNTVFSDPDPGTVFFFNAAASNPNILPFVQGVSLKLNSVPNFFGSGNVVVSANDGFGRTVVRDTFAVTYTPVNDPPVVSAAFPNVIFAVNTSDSLDLDQYVIDADHDTTVLNWQAKVISAQPMPVEIDTSDLDVAIDPLTHVATFSATPDSGGIFHVKFTVSDPAGLSDTDTIKVTVYGAGISPSVVNPIPDVSYPEDSGLHIVANDLNTVFFDPDPTHTFSFSTASGNQNIQFTIQGNTLWVGSSANFFGSSDAIVFADNGNGVTLSDTFQVTITPVNDPPAISSLPDTVTFASNTSTDLDVWQYVSDLETADSLLSYAFTVSNDSLLKSYNAGSGILTLSAAAGFTGDVTLRIRITDPENATAEDTLTVVVSPIVGIYGPNGEMPLEFALEQNYPNPFNPATTIKFQMPAAESVRLVVYNILGQKVRILVDERLEAGYHQVHWDGLSDQGQQLASGIYIYRIEAGNFTVVRKMTLLK